MADRTVITAENLRDSVGVRSVINTRHSGIVKRPTETIAEMRMDSGGEQGHPVVRYWIDREGNKHKSTNGVQEY